jgi:hypothetical protein
LPVTIGITTVGTSTAIIYAQVPKFKPSISEFNEEVEEEAEPEDEEEVADEEETESKSESEPEEYSSSESED